MHPQKYATPTRGGNTSAPLSAPAPAPASLVLKNSEKDKELESWIKKYREQSAKFDRLQVAHCKLKSQHKDHEATLEKERLRHEVEIEELRMQLRQERQLRENQETRMKSGERVHAMRRAWVHLMVELPFVLILFSCCTPNIQHSDNEAAASARHRALH